MDIFDSSYYVINKKYLICFGLWPFQSTQSMWISYIFTAFGFCCICLPQIFCLAKNYDNFEIIMETMPFFGCYICLTKMCSLAHGSEKVKKLLNTVKDDWSRLTNKYELEIMKKYAERGRKITIYYTVMVSAPLIAGFIPIPPLLDAVMPLNESRPFNLIFNGEFFVDEKKYFILLYFIEIIGIMTCATTVVTCDTLYMVLTQHACAVLHILNLQLENVTKKKTISEVNRSLIECVKLHFQVMEYTKLLQETLFLFFLTDVFLGILLEGGALTMVIISAGEISKQIRFGGIAVTQLSRIFINTLPAQQLTNHGARICFAAYNNKWYDLPEKSKKIIQFITMRSQMPCELKVANILIVNLETFNKIIKTTLSYVAVFSSLHNSSL